MTGRRSIRISRLKVIIEAGSHPYPCSQSGKGQHRVLRFAGLRADSRGSLLCLRPLVRAQAWPAQAR